MTEQEFYREKIFNKAGINQLRSQYPNSISLINLWYKSERYNKIQNFKAFLVNKLKQIEENGDRIILNYELFVSLFEWWEQTPKNCYYCGLPENTLYELNQQVGHINKRHPKRGKSLEIDRKQSHLEYNVVENLVLACYWCNNAKKDTFTEEEFLKIGSTIKTIWESRLGRKI